jgi:hypothetical protein
LVPLLRDEERGATDAQASDPVDDASGHLFKAIAIGVALAMPFWALIALGTLWMLKR